MKNEYEVGQLVYIHDYGLKGVGKVIAVDEGSDVPYLVKSTSIECGFNGTPYVEKQDDDNNAWFMEQHLKPFTKNWEQAQK